jgi:hypothetical protein
MQNLLRRSIAIAVVFVGLYALTPQKANAWPYGGYCYRAPAVTVYAPVPRRVYYPPAPVYVAPRAVYVAPPPVYVAPPAVYVSPFYAPRVVTPFVTVW